MRESTGFMGRLSGAAATLALWGAVMLLGTALSACSGGADPPQPGGTGVALPVVTGPQSVSVQAGQTATFTVTATGTGLSYQWQKNQADIPGATAASYTTPATTLADSGATFLAKVTNAAGTVTSATATLTVTAAPPATPTITLTTPPAPATVAAGTPATFSVTASCSGGTLTYQWQKAPAGSTTFADVAGATLSSYSTPATVAGDSGSQFRVNLSCGTASQSSPAATLTVTSAPPPATGAVLSLYPIQLGTTRAASVHPVAIAQEPSGSYAFVEANAVRRLSADFKAVSTVVGDNRPTAGTQSPFKNLRGIVVAASGTIYVTDATLNAVYAVSGTSVALIAGGGAAGFADGTGSAASFNGPNGIALGADGDLYVSDSGNNAIRRVTTAGAVSTYAGSGFAGLLNGAPATARFSNPRGIAVDGANQVYVADADNNALRLIARSGSAAGGVSTLAVPGGVVNGPNALALSGTTLVVGDGAGVISKVDTVTLSAANFAGGSFGGSILDGQGVAAGFETPLAGVAIGADGSLLVADQGQLRKVSATGAVITLSMINAGGLNTAVPPDGVMPPLQPFYWSGSAGGAAAVAVDASGNLLISEPFGTIRKVSPTGVVTGFAGLPGYTLGCHDGAGTVAQLRAVGAIAVGSDGTVYFGDNDTAVRRIDPVTQVVSLDAGSCSFAGATDGAATSARFSGIQSLAVDGSGNVYVGSCGNNAVRKIDTLGNVSTFAGILGQTGNVDGPPGTAKMSCPHGLTFAPGGVLYAADDQSIRRIAGDGSVTTVLTDPDMSAGVSTQLVADTDGSLYYFTQAGLKRLAPGSSTPQVLNPSSNATASNLSASPQQVGNIFKFALLGPKQLVILDADGVVLKAVLP
jgi:sugar lactone lactonase YvrE